jgi:hypothetical protein
MESAYAIGVGVGVGTTDLSELTQEKFEEMMRANDLGVTRCPLCSVS